MNATDAHLQESALSGKRILVVEDEMMVAIMIEDMLTDLGCTVTKAGRIEKAITLIETTAFDGAILDINVAGTKVYPVVLALENRNIPFIFSSGYGADGLLAEYRTRPTLSKPFKQDELGPMLAGAIRASLP